MAEQPLSEAQVKAAFLVNFTKYVDWPDSALSASNSPIVIGVFGGTEVTDYLPKLVENKIIKGHPLAFKRVNKVEEITNGCQLVFIAKSEEHSARNLVEKLQSSSVLTVGETDDNEFVDLGGMINLIRRDRNVRLQVNLAAAKQAGLKISSVLLSVSEVMKAKSK